MGNARWDDSTYTAYAASISHTSRADLFGSRALDPSLDPSKITVREAVDSAANPNSTPIILASDVTGSMGSLAEVIIKKGLGKIMGEIYTHRPIPDPQICCMATGDGFIDTAPLQVTQFEAAVEPMTAQLAKIWLEGGGGGNAGESYMLAWWFAVNKVTADAITKRHRKGYLFTIGDEACLGDISKGQQQRFLGVGAQDRILTVDVLKQAQEFWNVFHLIVKPVPHQPVVDSWTKLLGANAVAVENPDLLAETVVAIIRLCEGQHDVVNDADPNVAQAAQRLIGSGA